MGGVCPGRLRTGVPTRGGRPPSFRTEGERRLKSPAVSKEGEEVVYAPPLRFDVAIGYWTGEVDEAALQRAEAALRERRDAVPMWRRCAAGHLHVRAASPQQLTEAEALLRAEGLTRLFWGCPL